MTKEQKVFEEYWERFVANHGTSVGDLHIAKANSIYLFELALSLKQAEIDEIKKKIDERIVIFKKRLDLSHRQDIITTNYIAQISNLKWVLSLFPADTDSQTKEER